MNGKEERAREMFSKLKEHIGKEVTIKYWWYGKYFTDTTVLRKVFDFERIETDTGSMPFIGYGIAIVCIEDANGNTLYAQPLFRPYDVRDSLKIIEAKRVLFGDEVADKALEEHKKYEERKKEYERKEQEDIKKFQESEAQELIDRTLPYVVEDQKEKFKMMVANNSGSMYGIIVVKMTSELLIAIGQGMDFEEAIRTIADEKYGTSGYAMGVAANAISHCSARGEEFRKYWNRLHGISEEEPGVVNPAILTISKK